MTEKKKKVKKEKKKKNDSIGIDEKQIVIVNNIQSQQDPTPELRTISLYGDITERKGSEVVAALLYLESTSLAQALKDPVDPESDIITISRPIDIYISTHGGSANDMFSILDVMEAIKKTSCDINTHGIGKVMSAGVPILAAGTPGKRKLGKNCRIMIHNVMGGMGGTIYNMESDLEEIKWIQEKYIETLANYTKMTKTKIKKMLKSQRDVYISAEEAIKLGIADEII